MLTTRDCFNPTEAISIICGKKQTSEAAVTIIYGRDDYHGNDSNIQLIRLYQKSSKPEAADFPCILGHTQYHKLNMLDSEGVYTTRSYKNKTNRWNLVARRGKTVYKCNESGYDICLRIKPALYDFKLTGSSLMIRNQGTWYLAGIGKTMNGTVKKTASFTPLWTLAKWIATVMREIDSNCRITRQSDGSIVTLCDDLSIKRVHSAKGSKLDFV